MSDTENSGTLKHADGSPALDFETVGDKLKHFGPIPPVSPELEAALVRHGCGATSSKLDGRWDDVPFEGVDAAARRFAFGRSRHGKGNWQKGDAEFAEERLNHMLRHAFLLSEHRRWEDLEAVLCNAMMLAWYAARDIFKLTR